MAMLLLPSVGKAYPSGIAGPYDVNGDGSIDAENDLLDVAKEGQHPRAYEVAGALIKNVADTVDKLQDLQAKLSKLKEVPNKTTANIKNALFVGSTTDLQKMLKDKKLKTTSEKMQDELEPIETKDDN